LEVPKLVDHHSWNLNSTSYVLQSGDYKNGGPETAPASPIMQFGDRGDGGPETAQRYTK